MNDQELAKFIKWLSSSTTEFKDKTPNEIVTILNKINETEDGANTIVGLINKFKEETTSIFKSGGKIDQLVSKYQKGKKIDQRASDKVRKEFHGVDLFEYSPNRYRSHDNITVSRNLKPGTNYQVLPNGVGLRQITRQNTTTSELVSPDKKDTLFINNAGRGRVDSNLSDAGILGALGLKSSSPVSSNFRVLQGKFSAQKFANESSSDNGYKAKSIINPDGSITQILEYPLGKKEFRDISSNKQDTVYTNSVNGISRRNHPRWYDFVDKEANKKGYKERQERFNKNYKE
ncbi:MAG: hypothetical protein RRY26_03255 [Cellulosilyticaceae bacterium]